MVFFEKPAPWLVYEQADRLDKVLFDNHYMVHLHISVWSLDYIADKERHYNLAMILCHIFCRVVLLCGIFVLCCRLFFWDICKNPDCQPRFCHYNLTRVYLDCYTANVCRRLEHLCQRKHLLHRALGHLFVLDNNCLCTWFRKHYCTTSGRHFQCKVCKHYCIFVYIGLWNVVGWISFPLSWCQIIIYGRKIV
jgi:hypothetical protein